MSESSRVNWVAVGAIAAVLAAAGTLAGLFLARDGDGPTGGSSSTSSTVVPTTTTVEPLPTTTEGPSTTTTTSAPPQATPSPEEELRETLLTESMLVGVQYSGSGWYSGFSFRPTESANGTPYPDSLRMFAGCVDSPSYWVDVGLGRDFTIMRATAALTDRSVRDAFVTFNLWNGDVLLDTGDLRVDQQIELATDVTDVNRLRIEVINNIAADIPCGAGPAPEAVVVMGNARFEDER